MPNQNLLLLCATLVLLVLCCHAAEPTEDQESSTSHPSNPVLIFLESINERMKLLQSEASFLSTSFTNFTNNALFHMPTWLSNRLQRTSEL
jgi:hypothetical protein